MRLGVSLASSKLGCTHPSNRPFYRPAHHCQQQRVQTPVAFIYGPQVSCEFAPTHLKLVITTPEGAEDYVLDKPLYSAVDPASCRYEVLRTKVGRAVGSLQRGAAATCCRWL